MKIGRNPQDPKGNDRFEGHMTYSFQGETNPDFGIFIFQPLIFRSKFVSFGECRTLMVTRKNYVPGSKLPLFPYDRG